MKQCARRRAE